MSSDQTLVISLYAGNFFSSQLHGDVKKSLQTKQCFMECHYEGFLAVAQVDDLPKRLEWNSSFGGRDFASRVEWMRALKAFGFGSEP